MLNSWKVKINKNKSCNCLAMLYDKKKNTSHWHKMKQNKQKPKREIYIMKVTLKTKEQAEVYAGESTGKTVFYTESKWTEETRAVGSVLGRGYTEEQSISDWLRRAVDDGHSVEIDGETFKA